MFNRKSYRKWDFIKDVKNNKNMIKNLEGYK